MKRRKIFKPAIVMQSCIIFILLIATYSCKKDSDNFRLHYYEVGFKTIAMEWRDSSFIVATASPTLISQIQTELSLPVSQRKMVNGQLISGNAGYNKNASHQFKWHFKVDNWELADFSVEIYDGRPFTDVDNNISYWLDTVKRFAPWNSCVKREIPTP